VANDTSRVIQKQLLPQVATRARTHHPARLPRLPSTNDSLATTAEREFESCLRSQQDDRQNCHFFSFVTAVCICWAQQFRDGQSQRDDRRIIIGSL